MPTITANLSKYIFSIFLAVNIAQADVVNRSQRSVFLKSENGSSITELKPGNIYKGKQDGVISSGRVIKSSDGINLVVEHDGKVRVDHENLIVRIIESIRAGVLKDPPDRTWRRAFKKAQEQQAAKEMNEQNCTAREKGARMKDCK